MRLLVLSLLVLVISSSGVAACQTYQLTFKYQWDHIGKMCPKASPIPFNYGLHCCAHDSENPDARPAPTFVHNFEYWSDHCVNTTWCPSLKETWKSEGSLNPMPEWAKDGLQFYFSYEPYFEYETFEQSMCIINGRDGSMPKYLKGFIRFLFCKSNLNSKTYLDRYSKGKCSVNDTSQPSFLTLNRPGGRRGRKRRNRKG